MIATDHPRGRRLRTAAIFIVKLALAGLLLVWLSRSGRLRLDDLGRVRADRTMIGVCLSQLAVLAIPLVRWRRILRARDIDLGGGGVVHVGLISYFAVLFLPATGGQEVVRLYYASRIRRGRGADLLASLVVDRFVGLIGLSLLAAAASLALVVRTGGPSTHALAVLVGVMLAVLVAITAVLVLARPPWLRTLAARARPLAALLDALEQFRNSRALFAEAVALSVTAHLANCVSMYFAFRALGTAVPLLEATAITPVVTLTSILPLTPLGLGIADTAAEELFRSIGVANGAEATMLVRGVTAVACALCGLAFLWPVARETEATAADTVPHRKS